MRILVVDDHGETRELIARHFERAAHGVKSAESVAAARSLLMDDEFDLIVLDVMLPDGSGIELCSELRAQGCTVPVLLLTARGEVRDRVGGLEAGADDYLVKPFALAELMARARALGRRGPILRDQSVTIGPLVVDLGRRRVSVAGRPVPLTAKELSIVEVLASKGGVVSRESLLETVWGDGDDSHQASLEVLIGRIRRKLEPCGTFLRTVRGAGYALEAPE